MCANTSKDYAKIGMLGFLAGKNITNWLKRQERIVSYYKTALLCKYCKRPIPYLQRDQKSFCCRSCMVKYGKETIELATCKNCGKQFAKARTSTSQFCCCKCSAEHRLRPYIASIERNEQVSPARLRSYLLRKYTKCMSPTCKWDWDSGTFVQLEMHHIDGNANNNCLSNVVLLCPNCHSLTDTYKAKNKGKGRVHRLKAYISKELIDKYVYKK